MIYHRIKAFLTGRSAKWPAVRAKFLKDHPYCTACGGLKQLEVHHIRPFHIEPAAELDPTNLVTLCEKRGCHFAFGHGYDWKAAMPGARFDAEENLKRSKARVYS